VGTIDAITRVSYFEPARMANLARSRGKDANRIPVEGNLSETATEGTGLTTGGGHGYGDTSRHHHTGSAYFRRRLVRPGALVLGFTRSPDLSTKGAAASV
jgi:hypothetical protein